MPFRLFRKKEDQAVSDRPVIEVPATGTLSIQQAQDVLRKLDLARVDELAGRLAPIKESVGQSLHVIDGLANDMEHEKLKLEGLEHRFKSLAENARKTVVSSLRREASTDLPLPKSANDVKKFRERFEAMMSRFGEVSGSHSKVLNAFMKKRADKMREEFESLTKLLNQTKAAISDYEQSRMPIIKCNNILNTSLQKVSTIRSTEALIHGTQDEILKTESEIHGLKSELEVLKTSPEFERDRTVAQKAEETRIQREQFHAQLTDLFSHVSRGFIKYSYGLTKETEGRLQMMAAEPWKMLYEEDISPYTNLLLEIRKSTESGNIQLKDSDKIVHYLDVIINSLPELQGRAQALKAEAESLGQSGGGLVRKAGELEEKIALLDEELARAKQNVEQQNQQVAEKRSEVEALLREAAEILTELAGQKYSLAY